MKRKQIISFVIILIVCTNFAFFIGGKLILENKDKESRRNFINQMYFELNNCLLALDSIGKLDDKVNSDVTINTFDRFNENLTRVGTLYTDAYYFIDNNLFDGYEDNFKKISMIISGGLISNDKKICDGFLADGKLSKNERVFLKGLGNDLDRIKQGLYSKETKQGDPNLTIKDINKVFKPFFNKYSMVIVEGNDLSN